MLISSHDVSNIAGDLKDRLYEIKEKIEFYAKEELKNSNGSNFSFALDENLLIHLQKIQKILAERDNTSVDSDIGNKIMTYFNEMSDKFRKFEELLDNIYNSENKSRDKLLFYSHFFSWANNFIMSLKDIYGIFLEKFDIKEIIENKKNYEELLKHVEDKNDSLSKTINEVENKTKELLNRLEQSVSDKQVIEIKIFYDDLLKKTKKSKNIYGFSFYLSCLMIAILMILLFFNIAIFQNKYIIPRSILMFTFISFITFIVNDFRKRFNIEKQILDELYQKKNVVDAYAALLSTIKNLDDETKKSYHTEILKNITDTLLAIRNHGFLSKKILQDTPNMTMEIVNTLIDKFGNK
jgi:hypothetical protein